MHHSDFHTIVGQQLHGPSSFALRIGTYVAGDNVHGSMLKEKRETTVSLHI